MASTFAATADSRAADDGRSTRAAAYAQNTREVRTSVASEPRERSEPAKRRARERVGSPRGEAPRLKLDSGLRGSNPSNWLGKPGHYHYAKPARADQYISPSTRPR